MTSHAPIYPTHAMIRAGSDFLASLSTGEWHVVLGDNRGLTVERGIIIHQQDYYTRDYLDTCVHETLHASQPDLTEAEVSLIAGDIVEVLWKRGYRLPKPRKSRKKS